MKQDLKKFNIEELQVILENLKLGNGHLKKQLTQKQLFDLENGSLITKEEENECKIGPTEKCSHLAMALNSIITGIFGLWMGLATALNIEIISKLAQVGSLSLVCGGLIGITILMHKKKESKIAISKLKILTLTGHVYEVISQKQDEALNRLMKKLKSQYEKICHKQPEKEHPAFEKKEDFAGWFYLFHQAIHLKLNEFPKDEIFQHYRESVLKVLKKTEDYFIEKGELVGNFAVSLKRDSPISPVKNEELSALDILVDPSLSKLKAEPRKIQIDGQKILGFLFDLFPTILGALGSILMWCNSFPLIAKFFNLNSQDLLTHSCVPTIKIYVSLIFTLNFIFFYCYSQKKKWQRQAIIDSKKRKILNQDALIIQQGQRLNLVTYLTTSLDEIIRFIEYSHILKAVVKNGDSEKVIENLVK